MTFRSDAIAEPATSQGAFGRLFVRSVAFMVLYVLLDAAAYTLPAAPFAATPWNPHPALAVVLVIDGGIWYAPAVFAAVALAEVLVREAPGTLLGTAIAWASRCVGSCVCRGLARACATWRASWWWPPRERSLPPRSTSAVI